jgi:hypothetical protein
MKKNVKVVQFICNRCSWIWIKKKYYDKKDPRMCPYCKSVKWNDEGVKKKLA